MKTYSTTQDFVIDNAGQQWLESQPQFVGLTFEYVGGYITKEKSFLQFFKSSSGHLHLLEIGYIYPFENSTDDAYVTVLNEEIIF